MVLIGVYIDLSVFVGFKNCSRQFLNRKVSGMKIFSQGEEAFSADPV